MSKPDPLADPELLKIPPSPWLGPMMDALDAELPGAGVPSLPVPVGAALLDPVQRPTFPSALAGPFLTALYRAAASTYLDLHDARIAPTKSERAAALDYIDSLLNVIDHTTHLYSTINPDISQDTFDLIRALSSERKAIRPAHIERTREKDDLTAIFTQCNPGLLTAADIGELLGYKVYTINNYRQTPRAKRLRVERAERKRLGELAVPEEPTETKRGFLMPISVASGHYYHELPGYDVPSTVIYRHARSPLAMFHAWAWGRRMYADRLEERKLLVCPFSELKVEVLRDAVYPAASEYTGDLGNPRRAQDISGLRLAASFYYEKAGIGISERLPSLVSKRTIGGGALVLPCPGRGGPVHLVIPEYQEAPTKVGPRTYNAAGVVHSPRGKRPQYTRLRTFKQIILDEIREAGFGSPNGFMDECRIRAQDRGSLPRRLPKRLIDAYEEDDAT